MDEVKYIEEIANGVKNLKKHLRKSVVKMCEKVLKPLIEQVHNRPNLQEKLKNSLKKHFQDIYWSLKLHLVFHCGTGNDPHELQEMGRSVYLTEDELAALPDQNCAVDPWSKLMEIVSIHSWMSFNLFLHRSVNTRSRRGTVPPPFKLRTCL